MINVPTGTDWNRIFRLTLFWKREGKIKSFYYPFCADVVYFLLTITFADLGPLSRRRKRQTYKVRFVVSRSDANSWKYGYLNVTAVSKKSPYVISNELKFLKSVWLLKDEFHGAWYGVRTWLAWVKITPRSVRIVLLSVHTLHENLTKNWPCWCARPRAVEFGLNRTTHWQDSVKLN